MSIHHFVLRRSVPPSATAGHNLPLTPMTSPALTTTESLAADAGRSGLPDTQQEDASDFGEEHSETNDVGDDQAPKQQPQKRRRVTRACDECRRKKIKCDGKQPCTHCTVYSYGKFSCVLSGNIDPLDRRKLTPSQNGKCPPSVLPLCDTRN